jgi:DNA-binding transcriptional ArsR family regulator
MEAKDVIASLGALAHEHRLATFRFLVQAGPNGLAAGLISDRLGIPPSSLTFHLQQLLHSGLVTHRRASRQVIYAADFSRMTDLLRYLTENCCGTPGGDCDSYGAPPSQATKRLNSAKF